jgi:hypothetical protein
LHIAGIKEEKRERAGTDALKCLILDPKLDRLSYWQHNPFLEWQHSLVKASITIVEVKPIYLYPPLQSKAATPSYLSKFSTRFTSFLVHKRHISNFIILYNTLGFYALHKFEGP